MICESERGRYQKGLVYGGYMISCSYVERSKQMEETYNKDIQSTMENKIENNIINKALKDNMVFEIETTLQHIKALKEKLELIPDTEQEDRDLAQHMLWTIKDSVGVMHASVTAVRVIPTDEVSLSSGSDE